MVIVRLVSTRYRSDGEQVRTTYTADQVDAVAAYCEELDRCYLLPASLIDGRRARIFGSQRPGMDNARRYTGPATTNCPGL